MILCIHVLEHVQEDRKAISELFRILKPGGWAVLQVPIIAEQTLEDPSVTDTHERERVFGQFDHVRRYEPDYKNRLEAGGFEVQVIPFQAEFSERDILRFQLITGEDQAIWMCRKPVPQ